VFFVIKGRFKLLSVNRQNGCRLKNIAYTFIPVHQGCVRDADKLSLSLCAYTQKLTKPTKTSIWEDLLMGVVLVILHS